MKTNDLENASSNEEPPEPPELGTPLAAPTVESESVPTTGRRQALRNIRRQLTEGELAQTGTQKMLLEMLEEAETQKEGLKSYVTSFYEADKRAAILGEKLNADRSVEIFFGAGVGLGGTILGLAPTFWTINILHGILCTVIGLGLIIGSCIGRAVKK